MRRLEHVLFAAALGCTIASIASAQQAGDSCPPSGFTPQLMTPAAGDLPSDGALVVAMYPGGSGTSRTLPPLSLTRGRRSIALRSEAIAPGLFRVIPETPRITGSYALSGIAGAPELVFRRAPLAAPPTRPTLERAERYLVASGADRRLEVRAHLAFPMPAGVLAVLSYWDADERPDAFVRAAPTQRSIVLFAANGECDARPEGTNAPPESGGRVRIAFVDVHGQVSELSEPKPIQ